MKNETSRWWWFDSHRSYRRSPWLQSTLGELDEKIKAMIKLVEEDADSFAQRAEMYFNKRPEIISMVEDFYRAHRSLAERYDQLKTDSGSRLLTTLGSPFSVKFQPEKPLNVMDQSYDSHSEIYDAEDSAESEVDDPEQEDEAQAYREMKIENPEQKEVPICSKTEVGVSSVLMGEKLELREELQRLKEENRMQKKQLLELREELQRFKEENRMQKEKLLGADEDKRKVMALLEEENRVQNDKLVQKDEEKREAIRQLCLAVEAIKSENMELRKRIARGNIRKRSPFEFEKLKEVFLGKLFTGSPRSRGCVVAL